MPTGYESIGRRHKPVPLGELCPICNQRHTKCAAHRRQYRDPETGLRVPCERVPTPGMRVCHYHGGKSLIGPANPNYKRGTHANPRFLPSRFLESAAEIRDDPEHGTMKRAILLCELRMDELLKKIDERVGIGTIDEIRDALFDLKVSYESGDEEETLSALESAIELAKGNEKAENKAWKELLKTMGDLRRAIDSERKRQIVIGDYIPREQVQLLARELMGIVSEYVPDRNAKSEMLRKIAARVELTSRASREHDASITIDADYRELESARAIDVGEDGEDGEDDEYDADIDERVAS